MIYNPFKIGARVQVAQTLMVKPGVRGTVTGFHLECDGCNHLPCACPISIEVTFDEPTVTTHIAGSRDVDRMWFDARQLVREGVLR